MALKTLSTTFLSPLSLSKSKFPQHLLTTKPGLILCEFSRSQKSRLPADESEGIGAAAPSPGEKFLERQQSYEAAKLILKENKKRKKKKDNAVKASRNVASCYGCGAPLHTSDAVAPGYVDPETYELKKKHHQLRTVLCRRCQLLSHGEMITAVGGHGGYPGGKLFVTAEELREKLSHLRHEKALIVKLVDIVDFNGSFLSRVRDLAGSNPIILVVTKVDLLPRDTDLNCVGDWVVEATMRKKLNVLSVHLTSSKSLVGVTGVISEIQKEKKGRDVYILGSANVGKSAFINALLKTMAINDPVAASAQRYKPIQSAVPGTTLGPIQINAFLGGGKLYDTPGVHLHHRQTAVVQSEDLPSLAPRSRLRGISFPRTPVSADNVEQVASIENGLNAFSVFWGGLVRIDLMKVLPETCLTFYGPKGLQIHMVPTEQADEFYQKELGVLLTPPSGGENVESWKGLESERKLQIKFEDVERPACDIAISGLGWFTVEPFGRSHKISQSKPVETTGELILVVRVPKPVEIFVRPPIPVGKAGAEWYQYVELTEKEEEMRPKWYF
ncbi:NO-associated protein 1, chloroplastic/mitochondrial [Vigna unguiculata]|uniref:Nitric-oxide synthase n=1 Tax=Vigna unguiculata TaxID=3917 RepID=A0A4D6LK50_VIGUN|nr:NO-associated protein 1, chloroplastic/mitochondrial [Vigna unguiculata]QCD88913.1 nitric-oxide synthase [Vigna unguiculata]